MPKLTLKVIGVKNETPTINSVKLDLSGNSFGFKPGQYAVFQLKTTEGKLLAHDFSIASSPTRLQHLQFATRFRPESEFKKAFWNLKEGDEITVIGPAGEFIYSESIENAVFLSGGIGITPL